MNRLRAVLQVSLIGLALILATSSVASANTPHEEFLKKFEEIAPFAPGAKGRLCMCKQYYWGTGPDVGELRPRYGTSNGHVSYTLVCIVPTFQTSDGTIYDIKRCPDDEFEILPRE